MIDNLFDTTTVPVLEQVVNFAQTRHGVLAGNIANLDTPGYKTRDLSPQQFQENLKEAIHSRDVRQQAGRFSSVSEVAAGTKDFEDVRASLTSILYHDESDVSMERQIAEISKNQAQYNLAINLMSAQFRLLRAAISERAV